MNIPIINRQNDLITRYLKTFDLSDRSLLEICCGEGKNLKRITKSMKFKRVVGVDLSAEAVRIARKKKTMVQFMQKDIFKYDPQEKFDIILALMCLEHFKDDKALMHKIESFSKKGSLLIVTVPAHMARYSRSDKLIGHYRRYERKDLFDLLQNYQILKMYTFGFPVSNMYNWAYNAYLKVKGDGKKRVDSTLMSGISKYRPNIAMKASAMLFPILSKAIKADAPFLNTDLGTHFFIVAEKL